MAVEITGLEQFIVVLGMAIIFTILAFSQDEFNRKHIITQYFAAITYFCSMFINMAIASPNTFATMTVTYLLAAFGLFFSIAALYNSALAMKGGF